MQPSREQIKGLLFVIFFQWLIQEPHLQGVTLGSLIFLTRFDILASFVIQVLKLNYSINAMVPNKIAPPERGYALRVKWLHESPTDESGEGWPERGAKPLAVALQAVRLGP